MKIGIFGGTFNPPHKTHINMAVQAKQQLGLDELLVFPCGDPPHKKADVDKRVRLQLTRLAFQGIATVCDYELNKEGKSYTLDTVKYVKNLYPNAQVFLIIGGDSLQTFGSWYQPDEIVKLCTLAVVERRGVDLDKTTRYAQNAVFVQSETSNVSSTEIRLRYLFGLDNGSFVASQVDEYVKTHKLYRKDIQAVQKLKGYLNDDRFWHTYYVVKRGLQLAPSHLKQQAFWACLLHDCAKNLPKSSHEKYGFVQGDIPNPVVHAFLGEIVARKDFGICDQQILDAIKYHCTAKANMSELEMLVYVADKTEETRPYPLEHLLKGSLQDMFVACLVEANGYAITAHGKEMYYLTKEALEYYA